MPPEIMPAPVLVLFIADFSHLINRETIQNIEIGPRIRTKGDRAHREPSEEYIPEGVRDLYRVCF